MVEKDDKSGDSLARSPRDFSSSIRNLEQRAKAARRRSLSISAALVLGAGLLVSFVVTNVFDDQRKSAEARYSRSLFDSPPKTLADALGDDIRTRLSNRHEPGELVIDESGVRPPYYEPGDETREAFDIDLNRTFQMWKEAINSQTALHESEAKFITPFIGSAVFSIGVVGIAVLVIQIAVGFIRYNSQLAELFDAQANALRASAGDPELAYKFMEHFSPTVVQFGKDPTTMYEKALETVREVAKRPR